MPANPEAPVRMLLINKGVSPLVRIPAVTRNHPPVPSVHGLDDFNHAPTLGIFKLHTSLLLRDLMDTSLVAEWATLARQSYLLTYLRNRPSLGLVIQLCL